MYNYFSQSSYLASIFFSSQQAWIICISILRGFCIFRLLHFIALFQLYLKLVPEWQWWNVFRGGCEDRLRKCSYLSYTLPNEGFICWCQSLCSRFLIFGDVSWCASARCTTRTAEFNFQCSTLRWTISDTCTSNVP